MINQPKLDSPLLPGLCDLVRCGGHVGHDKIFLSGASLMGILLSIFSQGLGDAMHVMWHCCQQSSMDRPRSSPSYIEQHVRTDVTKFVVVSVGARVVTPRARSQACFRCAHPRKTGRAVLQALGIASKHGTKKACPLAGI